MNAEHVMLDVFAGAACVLALLGICFFIGFVVTCGVWKADAFMDRLDARREARMGLLTVDGDYERLCEEQD